ncbi:MAG: mechanosensitive ion channel family protein [Chloroflexi bacterium]|nr:mechanosensitive ion channel family protein [Chloroflexota bacterium]
MIDWIESTLGLRGAVPWQILATVIVVVAVGLARFVFLRTALRNRHDDPGTEFRWRKSSTYIAAAVMLVLVAIIWSRGVLGIVTSIGIVTAGLAIALQDPIVNMAGWLFIMWRRPFKIGDRVQIGEHTGDVIDMRVFQFTLLEIGNWVHADQTTGRILHVPNGKVFTSVQANYDQEFPYIWHEIPVLITFESDWQLAKSVLQEVVDTESPIASSDAEARFKRAAKRFYLQNTNLKSVVYTSVEDSGVLLTMRYLCEPRKRRATIERIWERVLTEFGQADNIELAYPTLRYFTQK